MKHCVLNEQALTFLQELALTYEKREMRNRLLRTQVIPTSTELMTQQSILNFVLSRADHHVYITQIKRIKFIFFMKLHKTFFANSSDPRKGSRIWRSQHCSMRYGTCGPNRKAKSAFGILFTLKYSAYFDLSTIEVLSNLQRLQRSSSVQPLWKLLADLVSPRFSLVSFIQSFLVLVNISVMKYFLSKTVT